MSKMARKGVGKLHARQTALKLKVSLVRDLPKQSEEEDPTTGSAKVRTRDAFTPPLVKGQTKDRATVATQERATAATQQSLTTENRH
jgi:hypothetical protein